MSSWWSMPTPRSGKAPSGTAPGRCSTGSTSWAASCTSTIPRVPIGSWTGQPVGTVVVRASGGLMLALKDGFAAFDPENGELTLLHDPEPPCRRTASTTASAIRPSAMIAAPWRWPAARSEPDGPPPRRPSPLRYGGLDHGRRQPPSGLRGFGPAVGRRAGAAGIPTAARSCKPSSCPSPRRRPAPSEDRTSIPSTSPAVLSG